MKRFLFSFFLMIVFTSPAYAEDQDASYDIDHLALATVMIYDGRLDKAELELSQVDVSEEGFDAARYYTIKGVLDSKKGQYETAIENYTRAIQAIETGRYETSEQVATQQYLFSIGKSGKEGENVSALPVDGESEKKEKLGKLHLYLAQACFKINDYASTVKHLDLAEDKGKDRAALFAFRAECFWKLNQFDNAINALTNGLALFPEDSTLFQQKYYYFADLGLYQAAVACARQYMNAIGADDKEYITLAQVLIEAGQLGEAITILETAKAKFPNSANVNMLLGHAYMKKNMYYTTASLFKDGAYIDKKYLKDAVEMHRRVKDYSHAIFLNAQMDDMVEKLKQQVAIFLDRGEFGKVIGLKNDLERHNLLEDDNLRYALAYSYYMVKDFANAEHHIKLIQLNTLFVKGTVILGNIERCRENIMECF